MKNFSYMRTVIDINSYYQIDKSIRELRMYFAKCNPYKLDEAMEMSFFHALTHYSSSKGDLKPYLMSLARDILKTNHSKKEYCFEFMEDVVRDTAVDISTGIVDSAVEVEVTRRVSELALTFMNFFILLSESMIQRDTNTRYYSKEFKSDCLRLVKSYDEFNSTCLQVYNDYGDSMKSFLSVGASNSRVWKEADYGYIATHLSKRVKLIDENRKAALELDSSNWFICGSLGDKRVVKINYVDAWDKMCSLISEESGHNAMRFNMEGCSVLRTLGGSWSIVNPQINHYYELTLDEILTNLIHLTGGRHLGRGLENFYFIVDDFRDLSPIVISGVEMKFVSEDITDSITKVSR